MLATLKIVDKSGDLDLFLRLSEKMRVVTPQIHLTIISIYGVLQLKKNHSLVIIRSWVVLTQCRLCRRTGPNDPQGSKIIFSSACVCVIILIVFSHFRYLRFAYYLIILLFKIILINFVFCLPLIYIKL